MTQSTSERTRGEVVPLGTGPWPGIDPFLFAAHHDDRYPAGDDSLGPAGGVGGRALGADFGHPSGWSMYHGDVVPGFPAHPHRGFETVTLVADGLVDHADSTGASARYGGGDVQWVTAGGGVSHSEMFPLVHQDAGNPLDLYQIWLNLPARNKLVAPEFKMLWAEDLPVVTVARDTGGPTGPAARVRVVAGSFGDATAPAPPANSWASDPSSDVAILLIELEPGAAVELPATAGDDTRRVLYVHGPGASAVVDGTPVPGDHAFAPFDGEPLQVAAGDGGATVLVLQAVPIGEPVAQHGPFVMNTREELAQSFDEYRRTEFGGWPWPDPAPTHGRDRSRFALHGDGRLEEPAGAG